MEEFDKSFHPQGSKEWFEERLGKFTSSKCEALLVESKTAGEIFGDGALTYIHEKLDELLTGMVEENNFRSDAIDWGLAHEPEAIEMYEKVRKVKVDACGFVQYNDWFGGSPDGLVVDDNGIIEVKCPHKGSNFTKLLIIESADDFKKKYKKHYSQIQGNLLATKKQWCDFIAYNPRPRVELLRIKIIRIYRDESFIKNMETRIEYASERVVEMFEYAVSVAKSNAAA